MKTRKTFAAWAALIMIAASLAVVAPAGAAGDVDQIVVKSQDTDKGQVVVDSVMAAEDGWLVIYSDSGLAHDYIVGYAPVHKGLNTNFTVNVSSARVEHHAVLWAILHADNAPKGVFEVGLGDILAYNDPPVPNTPVVAFGTRAPLSPAAPLVLRAPAAPGTNKIVIKNQETLNGQIVVDSVTTAEEGWLVVYSQPGLSPHDVIGYAPVRKGLNTNLTVDVSHAKAEHHATLWAALHSDRHIIGTFEWEADVTLRADAPMAGSPLVGFGTKQ